MLVVVASQAALSKSIIGDDHVAKNTSSDGPAAGIHLNGVVRECARPAAVLDRLPKPAKVYRLDLLVGPELYRMKLRKGFETAKDAAEEDVRRSKSLIKAAAQFPPNRRQKAELLASALSQAVIDQVVEPTLASFAFFREIRILRLGQLLAALGNRRRGCRTFTVLFGKKVKPKDLGRFDVDLLILPRFSGHPC